MHDNNFDILRVFGALMVLWGHTFSLLGGLPPAVLAMSVNTLGVKVFFVISGFLIAKSWQSDPHVPRFASRRALRIFPALAGVVLFSIIILGPIFTTLPLGEYFTHPQTIAYLRNIAMHINYPLPGVFADNTIPFAVNGSLWTLPVELVAYTLCPIALIIAFRLPLGKMLLVAMVAGLIVLDIWGRFQPAETQAAWTVYATNWLVSLQLLSYFAIGLLIAVFNLDRYMTARAALVLVVLAVILPKPGYWVFAPAFLIIPVVTLGFALSPRIRVFDWLTRKGDYSYGLYLYAYPVQQAVVATTDITNPVLHFTISAIVTFILAVGSWHLIEAPALRFKPTRRKNPVIMPPDYTVPVP